MVTIGHYRIGYLVYVLVPLYTRHPWIDLWLPWQPCAAEQATDTAPPEPPWPPSTPLPAAQRTKDLDAETAVAVDVPKISTTCTGLFLLRKIKQTRDPRATTHPFETHEQSARDHDRAYLINLSSVASRTCQRDRRSLLPDLNCGFAVPDLSVRIHPHIHSDSGQLPLPIVL